MCWEPTLVCNFDVVCDILLRFLIVCQNDCGLLTSGSTERTKAAFQLSHQAEFVIACIKRQIDCYNAIVWVESFSISWRVYWWIVELCFVVFLSMTISSMNRDDTVLELDERYPLAGRRRYGWGLGISPRTCNWTLSQPFHHLDKREKHILLIINLITSVKLKLKLDIKDIS